MRSLRLRNRGGRNVGLPVTKDGYAPTITAVYETIGAANIMSVKHYPKMCVGVIYEKDKEI